DHHAMSLLFHMLNVLLLFWLLRKSTECEWRSAAVAALFAVHPINVESVAWASERKNVLSLMLMLLAMIAYTRYTRRRSRGAYVAALGFFALGLAAKPQIIMLPLLLLLWDFWPLERLKLFDNHADSVAETSSSWNQLILEKIPFFLLSAGSAI